MSQEMKIVSRLFPKDWFRTKNHPNRYDVILIRGAPGVGKSTLATGLQKKYPGGITVETDSIRLMINSVEWIHTEQDTHCIEAAWAAAKSYLASGYSPVILIDTFGARKYRQAVSLLHAVRPPLSCHTISLYCADGELEGRIARRINGFSDIENSLKLNLEILEHRYRNETFIDTTGLIPAAVIDVVLRALG